VYEIDPVAKSIPRQWGLASAAVNGLTLAAAGAILYATSTSGSVFEIDLGSGGVRTVSPGGTLQDIAIAPDRSEMFIANEAGPLDIRNGATGMRITTVPAVTGAFGLKLSPDGTQLYATLSSTGEIKIIDVASRTVQLTLPVGGQPRRIAFDRFGTTALIPNENGFVSIIR
jgi:YVTN family beta-propeller protein